MCPGSTGVSLHTQTARSIRRIEEPSREEVLGRLRATNQPPASDFNISFTLLEPVLEPVLEPTFCYNQDNHEERVVHEPEKSVIW
jgi:hypothetical protein